MHWGPTTGQLMLATDDGCVNVYSPPDMTLLWGLKGHTVQCYCFDVDRKHRSADCLPGLRCMAGWLPQRKTIWPS